MSDLLALEQQLEGHKKLVEFRDMAIKLSSNVEFRKLILEEFMVQECARYTHTSADPALDARSQADALAIAQSAGHLKRYLSVVVQMGNVAANSMSELQETIELARAEDGEI